MKQKVILFLAAITLGLTGCAATTVAPPQENLISGKPFEITIPKNLTVTRDSLLKGVNLGSFRDVWGRPPVRDFFSVKFKEEKTTSELITEICRGRLHDGGITFKSCIYYDSHISIKEEHSSFHITITPYRVRTKQGRNALFLPIALPDVSLNKWYGWISNQTVYFKYKSTSKYPPESIKGNFDRNLERYIWGKGESDAALRQFKDTYVIDSVNKYSNIV